MSGAISDSHPMRHRPVHTRCAHEIATVVGPEPTTFLGLSRG